MQLNLPCTLLVLVSRLTLCQRAKLLLLPYFYFRSGKIQCSFTGNGPNVQMLKGKYFFNYLWQFLFAKFKVHGIGNVKNIFSIFQYFKMPFLGQDILDWKEKFVESKSVYLQMFKDSGPFEDNTFWLWLAILKTPFASIHVTFS